MITPEEKSRRAAERYIRNKKLANPNAVFRESLSGLTPEDRKQRIRGQVILRKYGVTAEEVEQTTALQNHCCAICFSRLPLVIDHCHYTGKFRAMLCLNCNAGIGMFNDSPVLLESAKTYLQKHKTI